MRGVPWGVLGTLLTVSLGAAPAARDQEQGISGVVFVDRNGNGNRDAGERGLAGVVVSNQQDVAQTDADGRYRLADAGKTGLVFVSLPSGYASRTWYHHTAPRADASSATFDFALTSVPATTSVTFIHASDTHIAEASVPRIRRLRALVDSIRPTFVLITGDLVRDALRVGEAEATGYYELFQREIAAFMPPVWTVPGNHEAFGIERDKSGVTASHPLYGRTMYRHYRGPDYYSFNAGGVHFVGLNSVDIDDTRYYGHVDSAQLAWLERDLAVLPKATPVVTFNHIPFFSSMESVHGLSPGSHSFGTRCPMPPTCSHASRVAHTRWHSAVISTRASISASTARQRASSKPRPWWRPHQAPAWCLRLVSLSTASPAVESTTGGLFR
jgi:hypothetical protein